eukprot:5822732-Pyramimonas_sp.AAC.2
MCMQISLISHALIRKRPLEEGGLRKRSLGSAWADPGTNHMRFHAPVERRPGRLRGHLELSWERLRGIGLNLSPKGEGHPRPKELIGLGSCDQSSVIPSCRSKVRPILLTWPAPVRVFACPATGWIAWIYRVAAISSESPLMCLVAATEAGEPR